MMYHRNGRYINGRGRWQTRAEIEAELEPQDTYRLGRNQRISNRPLDGPRRGYFQVRFEGEPGPIGPKSDLSELLQAAVHGAIKRRQPASVVNCQGNQVYLIDRDSDSKRWFIRITRDSRQARIPLARLERDRMVLRDPQDTKTYWISL